MNPEEIIQRVKNGQKFAEAIRPPGELTQSQTADWQIIANAALGLLHAIEARCPPDPLQVEAGMFVLRTLSVVSGAFTVRGNLKCKYCGADVTGETQHYGMCW